MNLLYCLNTQTVQRDTLPRKIRCASEAGFDAIEMIVEEVEDFLRTGTLPELRRMLRDAGLISRTAMKLEGWFERDGALMGVADDDREIQDECERRMALFAELGVPYIIASPSYSHRGRFAPLEAGVERFRGLLELGQQMGIIPTIAIIGQSDQINTIENCTRFLELVDDPDGKMVVDAYHLWRGSGTVEGFGAARGETVSALHISDCNPEIERESHHEHERLMPGDGNIDLYRFVEIAAAKDFDGVLCLGVYNRALWQRDTLEVCREGLAKTRAVVNRALAVNAA